MFENLLDPLSRYAHAPGDPRLAVRIDITNKCNLLCKMCHYPATVGQPKFDMDSDLMRKIVAQVLPHAQWATLSCEYEPLMARNFDEILDIIRTSPCPMGLTTNGTLFTRRRIDSLLDNPAIGAISISIDGGTRETFERIRVNGRWDKLMTNLAMLGDSLRQRRADGQRTPDIQFNTVLMKSTALELFQLMEVAQSCAANRVAAIRYVPINPELNENIDDWEALMPSLIRAKQYAHDHNIELLLPLEDPRLDPDRDTTREAEANVAPIGRFSPYCEAPWSAVQIAPNGDIPPCLYYGAPFGNLMTDDFDTIWNNEKYKALRRSLKRLKLHPQCAACNPHGYDNIERKARINTKIS